MMSDLKEPKFETIEDVKKELDKYRPVNLRTIAMLMEKVVQVQIERDKQAAERVLDALEQSRSSSTIS